MNASARTPLSVIAVATLCLIASPASAQVIELTENFASATQTASGWNLASGFWPAQNNSDNPQPYSSNAGAWGPGATLFVPAPGGNYFATDTTATGNVNGSVSDWLMTPVIALHNGDIISFATRTRNPEEGPSRMEVRLSTAGSSSNVGTLPTDVGAFTSVVNTVNSSLTANAYPTSWTTFNYTVTGLSGTPTGRVAFRTFYTNGGFGGPNGDTVGLATVTYTAVPQDILYTWTGTASASWNTPGNWSPSGPPVSSTGTQLTFATTANPAMTNDIAGTLTLNRMTFNAGAPVYTLSGNGLNFTADGNGVLPQIVTNSANSVTIGAPLTLTNTLTINGTGNVTLNGLVGGAGGLIFNSRGTLILSNAANTYSGGTNAMNGIIQVAADSVLGTGPVGAASLGTVNYTASNSTSRTFAMTGGTISVVAGQTLTFNGSQVSGGYLDGSGNFATDPTNGARFIGMTTTPSVTIASNSASDRFASFSNGGPLNIAANLNAGSSLTFNGLTNQGSGTVTVGANSQVNASNLVSYGVINVTPGTGGGKTKLTNTGTSPLGFDGGSRTFLGAIGGNGQAQLELNGQNAIVSGGLFVNNGQVTDSSAGGNATIIADYGALVKGAGSYDNPVKTQNGGRFQSGNSPGSSTFAGRFGFGGANDPADPANGGSGIGLTSNYTWQINNATGAAGPTPNAQSQVSGWSLIQSVPNASGTRHGDFYWDATPTDKLTFSLQTLQNPSTIGNDVQGPMANFNLVGRYVWPIVTFTGTYLTQNTAAYPAGTPRDAFSLNNSTTFDFTNFANPNLGPGAFNWNLIVNSPAGTGGELDLVYDVIVGPEPGTLALSALGLLGVWRYRKRRDCAAAP